jgi:hypothetical protein
MAYKYGVPRAIFEGSTSCSRENEHDMGVVMGAILVKYCEACRLTLQSDRGHIFISL